MNGSFKITVVALLLPALLTGCSAITTYSDVSSLSSERSETVVSATAESDFDGSILLARPTETEMTVSITPSSGDCTVFVMWGSTSGTYQNQSPPENASAAAPAVITMTVLSTNSVTYYRICRQDKNSQGIVPSPEYHFQMPRTAGSEYSFVVQADSHLLNKADPSLYRQSMQNMAAWNPDFLFDLGDAFLNDQVKSDPIYQDKEKIRSHYTQQLPFFSIVASGAPLYLTMGNHEGEYGHFLRRHG
jgi:hypothetical protein